MKKKKLDYFFDFYSKVHNNHKLYQSISKSVTVSFM